MATRFIIPSQLFSQWRIMWKRARPLIRTASVMVPNTGRWSRVMTMNVPSSGFIWRVLVLKLRQKANGSVRNAGTFPTFSVLVCQMSSYIFTFPPLPRFSFKTRPCRPMMRPLNKCFLWMNVICEWITDLMNELLNVFYFYWVRTTFLLKPVQHL